MKNLIIGVSITVVLFLFYFLGFYAGERKKQQEIKNRAKQINKECYTNQDIEIIVFGEIQE